MVAGLWGGPSAAFMLPFIPLAIAVLSNPRLGMWLAFPVLILIPYGSLRLPLPVLDSPLAVLIVATLAAALAQTIARRRTIPFTTLYYPIVVCVALMAANLFLGRGDDTGLRLYSFAISLWPFVFALLLVDTPRQARVFLLTAVVPLALIVALWAPTMAWYVLTGQGSSLMRASPSAYFSERYSLLAFLKPGGVIQNWMVLMVAPIFLSIGLLSASTWLRRLARVAHLICAAYLMLGTFAASIAALVFETLLVALLGRGMARPQFRGYLYLATLALVMLLVLAATGLRPVIELRFRIQFDPTFVGAAFSPRSESYRAGLALAARYPIVGIGGYLYASETAQGEFLPGHSFWIEILYQFGVFYCLAWVGIATWVCVHAWRLLRQTVHSEERAVLLGILGGLVTAITLSLVNPVLDSPGPDGYFWFFAALIVLWSRWRKVDPQAALL